ncbi:MAG: hypothetical protein OXU20_41005 [Myxococcales bacterium]|nr:hypothetical protein [Myxococcales bacterium]MDD9970986.1 hypothetical protein [Myxococcales bacterium]
MAVSTDLNLHPRQVAKPLTDIQGWRLPEDEDVLQLHRGVLSTLQAMSTLTQLEVPLAVDAREGASGQRRSEISDDETLFALLTEAERTLDGYPHRLRIHRVSKHSPGHARQLERARCEALDKIRSLRKRVDFIRAGLDLLEEPAWIRARANASRVVN